MPQSLHRNSTARARCRFFFALIFLAVSSCSFARCAIAETPRRCGLTFEGEVRQGQNFSHAGPAGLDFLLEAIPSGWIIRMLEHNAPRAEYDYAGLATPPYMSPNPILISTDFAFRAQDALGWNPRHFQYFASGTQFRQASAAYAIYKTAKPGMPLTAETSAAMSKLLTLSTAASSADLEILDAHLIGGMHDQSLMAATVASHFNATAHIVEQTDARPSPLGTITWMRFRVTFADSSSGKPCGVAKESTPRAQK